MSDRNIERVFALINRNVATINGTLDYDRTTDAIITLCNAINTGEITENTWYIGEGGVFSLSDFIAGAYWHFTHWHAGQESKSYAALCALGSIYSPGCEAGPEPDCGEQTAFELLEQMAS